MGIFATIITVVLFAYWTCSLVSMQWCSWLGWNAGVCRSLTSVLGRTIFPFL